MLSVERITSEGGVRVLVVDDDAMVAQWAEKVLGEIGFHVDVAHTADEGRALGLTVNYDLALIDLDLPDRNGLGIVYALRRAKRHYPIMIMTGNSEDDVLVSGLDAGADDYLVKPVSNAVLKARVRAALRRGGATVSDSLVCGNVALERLSRRVRVGDAEPAFTAREFSLLEYFLSRPGEISGRADLLERVWKMRFDTATNVVDATICRLRQKLLAAGATAVLHTVRGRGYRLSA